MLDFNLQKYISKYGIDNIIFKFVEDDTLFKIIYNRDTDLHIYSPYKKTLFKLQLKRIDISYRYVVLYYASDIESCVRQGKIKVFHKSEEGDECVIEQEFI